MIATLPPPLAAAALVRHYAATDAAPLPPAQPGITWVFAGNGVFKRGCDGQRDLLIRTGPAPEVPGLALLLPHVRYRSWPHRLPGAFLPKLLADARGAVRGERLQVPIEKQYFVVHRDGGPRLIAPRGQDASPGRVRYAMPTHGAVLCDIHSHHELPAFFSSTDDHDDVGLSVSVVIGRIFTQPEIACRINVYGSRQRVPARLLFDDLGPFFDVYGGRDADLAD